MILQQFCVAESNKIVTQDRTQLVTTFNNWSVKMKRVGLYQTQVQKRPSSQTSAPSADLDPLPSPVLVLLDHFSSQTDGLQVSVLLLLLLAAPPLSLCLSQRVDHGHVDIQVVGFLETLPAHQTLKLQICLSLVFGHVVL